MGDLGERTIAPIRLASEPPFRLGRLEFEPATRQVRYDSKSQTLEPRVMQVLVVLARANGAVVGRDELIEQCWDGRIVGDNAINRVISLIRHLADETGGAFGLETVTKVGYRLVAEEGEAPRAMLRVEATTSKPVDRRVALWVLTAVGIAAGGIAAWRMSAQADDMPPAARELIGRGYDALNQGLPEQTAQGLAYIRQATELAPESASTWGALALAYAMQPLRPGADPEDRAAWALSAAGRALAIDADNADARAASIMIEPSYRNWAAYEAKCRAVLDRSPDHSWSLLLLGQCLQNVGRWAEAHALYERALKADPYQPMIRIGRGLTLWGLGRLHESDQVFADAAELWPSNINVWGIRFNFLVMNGRAADALATASNRSALPPGVTSFPVEVGLAVARAIVDPSAEARRAAVEAVREAHRRRSIFSVIAAIYFCELGALDEAIAILGRYYFGTPTLPWQAGFEPKWPAARETFSLFGPSAKALRTDPRFPLLTRALGLDDYWRETGTVPDHRRQAKNPAK
jgi:DNA-binding winged helix-turn-helix (wHTH) protein/tetratricopeptide (TPR) repeat protein